MAFYCVIGLAMADDIRLNHIRFSLKNVTFSLSLYQPQKPAEKQPDPAWSFA